MATNLPSAMKKYMYSNLNQYKDNGLQWAKMHSVVQHPDNLQYWVLTSKRRYPLAMPPAPEPEPPEPPEPPAPPAPPAPTVFGASAVIMFIFRLFL